MFEIYKEVCDGATSHKIHSDSIAVKERGVNVAKNPGKPASVDAVESTEAQPKRTPNKVIGGNQLARTPKTESPTQTLYLKFTEPEDLAIFDKLKVEAKSKRYPVDVYILIKLAELYPPTPPTPATEAA